MNSIKVLIVDDDKLLRSELSKEVERNFHAGFQAGSGKEAMEIFDREAIDIIVLDVKLPDIDGLEFLEEVKKKKPDCEVVVVTGFGTQEIAIQALRRGAIDYIEKPINTEAIDAALGRAQEKISEKSTLSYTNTVLIIDDDEEILTPLSKFLKREGYSVFTAASGQAGLSIIENNKIDVFVTDIKLGDIDGLEVLKKAKAFHKDIEGIVVTGFKDEDLAVKALRAGAIDYINKPINLDGLLFSIEKAIEKIDLNRNRLYRNREIKISSEIISKMNEELERRIAERSKKLSQTQAQLFQTSKLATLGEMSTGLAHEMNQPLGGIALIVANLRKLIEKERLTDKELATGLNDIDFSVKRMNKVIQHIRTFSRQETLKFMEVEVNNTIESAMSLLGEQLRLHQVEVALDLGQNLPKISGEPYQLEQVWINLISNARDAMDLKEKRKPYPKKLIISTKYNIAAKEIEISFIDNGLGMPEENRKKMFDPFFTTKEVGKGSGLGLSISYGIIESHKGRFHVESKEKEGSSVHVVIPEFVKED